VRYRCERHCRTRTFITNSFRTLTARIIDISQDGVGLLLSEPLALGTRVSIELDDGGNTAVLEILADVLNVTAHPGGSWRCGCMLVWKLSEEELQLVTNGA